MSVPCRLLPLAAALLCAWHASQASATANATITFDAKTLAARGFNTDLANYFNKAPRFLPGVSPVQVDVNASRRYHVDAQFDNEGNLCVNAALLASLRLQSDDVSEDWTDIAALWQGADTKLFPGDFRLDITVPEAAFPLEGRDDGFLRGGAAALLNYRLFAQRTDSAISSFNFLQADLQPGLNIGSWAVRSRGVYSQGNEGHGYQQQEAYVQRPVESLNALAQFGQINTLGQAFGGLPILGAQIGSDQAQLGSATLTVPIQGLANSQATVEVRQRGRLLYRTVVQPGPFTLGEISGMAGSADLDVTVIEDDGQRRQFTVPALSAANNQTQAKTWSASLGRYRTYASEEHIERPLLLSGELAMSPTDKLRLTSGGLLSAPYQAIGAESTWTASDRAWLSTGARITRAREFGLGAELNAQGSYRLASNVSTSLSWLSRTGSYADASEAFEQAGALHHQPRLKHSAAASVSWAHPRWGAVSYVASYNRYSSNNAGSALGHSLNVGQRFGPVTANLSLQKQPMQGFGAYLSLSMPLGGGSLRGNAYQSPTGQLSVGSTYDGRIGPDQSYSIGVTGTQDDQRLSASTSIRSAYSTLAAGVSQSSNSSRSIYASADGALVYAGNTFATSPSQVGDTFAVVEVENQAGVRLQAPGSSSKTNASGVAVMPNIAPYLKGQLQVDSRSLPLNTRLNTTTLNLEQARGSVGVYRIGATETQQLLLTIRDSEGTPAALGASIYEDGGGFMGIIVGECNFMLTNEQIGKPLSLVRSNGDRCQVTYTAPETFDANSPYEETEGLCV